MHSELKKKSRLGLTRNLSIWIIFFTLTTAALAHYNSQLFLILNQPVSGSFLHLMYFVTAMADGVFIVAMGCFLFRFAPLASLKMFVALILVAILVQALKNIMAVDRPLKIFGVNNIKQIGMPLYHYSMPSGHAAAAMVFARFLIEVLRQHNLQKFILPAFLFGVLGSFSRITVGAHFPLDIWVGGILGFFLTDLIYKTEIQPRLLRKIPLKMVYILMSLLGLFAVYYYIFLYPEKYFEVDFILQPILVGFAILIIYFLIIFFWKKRNFEEI